MSPELEVATNPLACLRLVAVQGAYQVILRAEEFDRIVDIFRADPSNEFYIKCVESADTDGTFRRDGCDFIRGLTWKELENNE